MSEKEMNVKVEIPDEILDDIAGGMTAQEWNALPQEIRYQAQNISNDRKDLHLTCNYDEIVAELMAQYNQ